MLHFYSKVGIINLPTIKGVKKLSSIVSNKIGKYTYLYESESYRDEEGKPQNRRTPIGKIDNKTGKPIYRPEYLERVQGTDKQPVISNEQLFSVNDIKNSEIKEYGVFYLLDQIADLISLTGILKETFSNLWEHILMLAFYIVSTGEPAMYCEDWLFKTENHLCSTMSSQRISELLISISNAERMTFFEKWGNLRSEQEFFALDITSISSYSEFINDVEWGYNRDKEELPQINVCMLLGEKSKLPIFQTTYSGSLKDVSTLKTTLELASNLSLNNMAVVMDKGFCSTKNINAMLDKKEPIRFLLAVPFSLNFAKKQVESERKDIDTLDNTIVIGDDTIRGIAKERAWNSKQKLFTHIFCNVELASQTRNNLFRHITKLKNEALKNPDNDEYSNEFKKYLIIRKSDKIETKHTVNIRYDVVENALQLTGWLVLVSNYIRQAEEAINIYRSKDVVEKGFLRMKNCLDLARLRIHSDNSMQNKIFIGFIALILTAYIHKVMTDNDLYRIMTMKKLIKTLEKLHVQHIKGNSIMFPLTKEQKAIFKVFGLNEPL
jgi:transposase